ncbi:MAG: GNAT family N-acetyltransferase [Sphingobacteriales bacterium]|nr:GNAT family N-acetyltransferase [Sphingobacteriales bacterium]
MEVIIRKAVKDDVNSILNLIKELAEYEKAPQEVTVTTDELIRDGFGKNPLFHVYLAENKSHGIVGMAFWYFAYSTWKGKCIYLEDIIVRQEFRRQGIGEKLFNEVLKAAREHKAKRLMWQVLNWNTPAIEFYKKKYRAEISDEWLNGRLTENEIQHFELP